MAVIRRAIVPLLLLVSGIALLVAGAVFHSQQVLAQIEQKAPDTASMGTVRPPWMPPAPSAQATPQYVATWIKEAEPQLIKEITVGGLTLTDDSRLKRTYAGDTPSLCPT